MSYQAMAWAVEQKVGSPIGKMILIALANYADHEGRCFPSQKRLAEDCECSEKTIWNWLKKFEEAGLVARTHRQRKDGSRTSDELVVNPKIQTVTDAGREQTQTVNGSGPNRNSYGAYTVTKPITEKNTKKALKERDQYNKPDQPSFKRFMTEIWPHRWKDGDDRKTVYFAYLKLDAAQREHCAAVIEQAKRDFTSQYENQFRKGMAVWLNANGWEKYEQQKPDHAQIDWAAWMDAWHTNRTWHPSLGPEPGYAGCRVPGQFLQKQGEAA